MVQFGMPSYFSYALLIFFTLSASVQASIATPRQTLFSIQGSNTIGAKLAPALVEGYLTEIGAIGTEIVSGKENESRVFAQLEFNSTNVDKQQSNRQLSAVNVEITAHGSGTGFAALMSQQADIAAASRPAKANEIAGLSELVDLTSEQAEHIIAIDGLAIIVHPNNPIQQLSVQQLSDIFSGKVENWSHFGGRLGNINLYSRDDKSGTWDSFKRMVLGKTKLAEGSLRFESNDELSDRISLDINGIGFVGLPSVRKAKLLAISDGFTKALKPTRLSVATEDYALSRRLYFYTGQPSDNPYLKDFLKFVQSPKGQKIVADNGFISQFIEAVEPIGFSSLPEDFKQLTENGQRLTVNFRFKQGSAKLDNRAFRDIERLAHFSLSQPDKKLLLIGFGDQKKDHQRSQLLSKLRAMAVRRELVKLGIYPKFSHGYGEQLPVASNIRESGRYKNRRVEVWLSDND